MENTKYLEVENRFKRILDSNYSDEEKMLILHSDLVDVIRSSKELIAGYKGMAGTTSRKRTHKIDKF